MYSLVFLGLISFIASLLLTPVVRNFSTRWGIVDHPGGRKTHTYPIPRVGGVAIALAYLIAFGGLFVVGLEGGHLVWSARAYVWHLIPAAMVIFAVGLCDDLVDLKPWQKLLGEILGGTLAWFAGVQIHGFGGFQFPALWSLPLTVGWLLLCTNAVNLIDGLDGLAAGVGLFATATILLAALLTQNIELALATAPLAGALLGFLRFNFSPATIFLGDSGSLFIGFLLGCFGALWSQKSVTILGMTAPLMVLAIPLLDTALSIVRRFLRHQPIFGADRNHIHHRLLDRGFTPRKVALLLYGCCALGAIAFLGMLNPSLSGVTIVLFCAAAWIGIHQLGYVEFGLVGRMMIDGAFRRQVDAQIALQGLEQGLALAANPEECWILIRQAAQDLGFHHVSVCIAGRTFELRDSIEPLKCWSLRVPLPDDDFVELTRALDVQGHATAIGPFADILQKALAAKLPAFSSYGQETRSRGVRE